MQTPKSHYVVILSVMNDVWTCVLCSWLGARLTPTTSSPEILYVCVFLKEAQKSCHSHLRWLLSLPSQCCLSQTKRSRDFNVSSSSPLSQMDHVHKALIGSGFGLISPLKRKASSCGVCRLRFSCEVGVVPWETHALNCFSFRVLLYLTHTPSHDS